MCVRCGTCDTGVSIPSIALSSTLYEFTNIDSDDDDEELCTCCSSGSRCGVGVIGVWEGFDGVCCDMCAKLKSCNPALWEDSLSDETISLWEASLTDESLASSGSISPILRGPISPIERKKTAEVAENHEDSGGRCKL